MRKVQVRTKCNRAGDFGVLGRRALVRRAILIILLCTLTGHAAAAEPNAKNVLVLNSFSERSLNGPLDPLESSLRACVPWPINFYVEYLENRRFGDKGYEKDLVENLRNTYAGKKLDLVIVSVYPGLQFAVRHRDELFPGVPIVFFGIDARRIAGLKMWPEVTGVTETVDVRATIDLAFHLHPDTNTVAIITNNSDFEKYWLATVHAELLRDHKNVREIDLVALPTSQLLEKVTALPPQTVVLFQRAPLDSVQPAIGDYDILAWVGRRLPTYCIFPSLCLNHGGIGGAEASYNEEYSLVAELARRVLSGERPHNIPVAHASSDQIRVDWRQLQRWHIPESALPPGSVILYREANFWERDKKYIILAIMLIFAQALLIAGLLWQRRRKRKAEAVLRESEKRFRVMTDTTPSLVWMCDARGKITYLNERRLAFTGPEPDAGYGDTWIAYVHPDDQMKILDSLSQALKTRDAFSKEYRLRRSDGVYRWMFDVASPRVNGDGSFGGFIGSAIDTTDQKLAQQALEKVSGQLIEAQEKERSRIARDLHDDICQRLALLSMELDQANRNSNGPQEATKTNLQDIRKHCSEIARDVQSLSHQLHSSKLDYLGIESAIRGFAEEFSKQHEVNIEFSNRNAPTDLPKDVSLCLFRITQEALHNAVKYSGVSQFTVQLSGMEGSVELVVSDAGAGFDVEEAKRRKGLGLLSMQERIHLVHGSLSVESKPWQGTRIIATVPLVAEREWSTEDGEDKETTSVTGIA
jgi:PAS domain S-box-containing protein